MSAKKILAKDLWQERDLVLKVSETKLKATKDGFNTIPADSFLADTVTVMRANTFTKNFTQVFYFDEKHQVERPIIVPNDFLFTPADKETAQELMGKFKTWMLKNLSAHCHYMGSQIGCDPEIFVENEKGEIIPSFDFLEAKEKNAYVYWDGFQAEFTTNPDSCMDRQCSNIKSGLQAVLSAAIGKFPKAKLSTKTVFDISPDLLKKSKPEHVAFGCRPSLNAYGLKGRDAPGHEVTFRSAGGHIHFGFGDKIKQDKDGLKRMVKALDAILGVACVSMFAKYDDPRRRSMYGLAGEYRLPPHGLEYRPISNAWLFHPLIAHLVFDLARSTTTFGYKDFLRFWDCEETETIRIINECDVTAARKVLKKNKNILLQIINARYSNLEQAEFVYDILYHGIDSVLRSPTDIVRNWSLNGIAANSYWRVRDCMQLNDKV